MTLPRLLVGLIALTIVVVGAGASLSGCTALNQATHTNCVVLHKDRIIEHGSSGEKRLVTSCGTFAVEDSLTGGYTSYDTWTGLEVGRRYDIRTGGYRIGVLSMFPTVIGVTER